VLATAGIALMSLGGSSATVAAAADNSSLGNVLVGGAAVFYSMHVIRLGTFTLFKSQYLKCSTCFAASLATEWCACMALYCKTWHGTQL
jgi:hypothetical protein